MKNIGPLNYIQTIKNTINNYYYCQYYARKNIWSIESKLKMVSLFTIWSNGKYFRLTLQNAELWHWVMKNRYYSLACTEMATFFAWNVGKRSPFLGYTRKMRDLSIIPLEIINSSRIWGNNCVICVSIMIFFIIFCSIQCRHLTDQKVSSLRKLESIGQPTSSLWKPTIGVKLALSNLLTDIFHEYPKKGIFFPRFRQKSHHFCACMK